MFSSSLDELRVGARHRSGGRTITEADVVAFASLSGDRHPQHTDAAWAACSPFGERIAHGMLVLSYAAGLVPLDPERVLALRGVRDAVFKRPVRFGDTIAVETRIADIDPASGLVTCAWLVRNQEDRLVARATIDLLWRSDDPTSPAASRDEDHDAQVLAYAAACVPL